MILPPSLKFIGDKDRALELAPKARTFYYELSRFADEREIPGINKTLPFPDGSSIQCFSSEDGISGNRSGHCLIRGVKKEEVKPVPSLSFAWLSSSLSTGRLNPYFSHPTPKQDWLTLDAKETNYTKTSKRSIKFGSSWWKDSSSFTNSWKTSLCWTDGVTQSVIVAPIVFHNSIDAAYYSTETAISTDPSRSYIDTSLSWQIGTAPVYLYGCYIKGKTYILKDGLKSVCVSKVGNNLYSLIDNSGTYSIRIYSFTDIPTSSGDVYGTSSYTSYTLPYTNPNTSFIFSESNPKILYAIYRHDPDTSTTPFTVQYEIFKIDLTNLSSILVTSLYTSSAYNYLYSISKVTCFNGILAGVLARTDLANSLPAISFKESVGTFVFTDISSTLPSISPPFYYADVVSGIYVISSPGSPSGVDWKVIINGSVVYTRNVPVTTGSYPGDWIGNVAEVVDSRLYGSFSKYKDRVIVAMRHYDSFDTRTEPYFLDINKGVVTEIPQSISGMHSQIYLI